jgi:hypothetical protein
MPQDFTKCPKTVFERAPLLMCSVLEKMISEGPQSFLEAPHRRSGVQDHGIREKRL